MKLASHAVSETGPVRKENQDAVATLPEKGLFVVADGMGGHAGGGRASRIVEERLKSAHDLVGALREANREIFDLAKNDPELKGMGSTVVALRLAGSEAELLHVGDSRAYRLRGKKLEGLTRDHSFIGDLLARGEITDDDARRHPYRHVLTRAVGTDAELEPERRRLDVLRGDVFLLCSDGVSGVVSETDLSHWLSRAREAPEEACQGLVSAALDAGGRDNATAVIVHVEEL